MGEKFPLVCLDRDGTILEDDGNLYLGRTEDWKEKVKFLPLVVEGIRELNGNQMNVIMTTNQSGVALCGSEFDGLTEERMHDGCRYIIEKLAERGSVVGGYFACPFVNSEYAEKAKKMGRIVNPKYIDDACRDLKPNIGMVERAALWFGRKPEDCDIFVVGDRFTDVQTGLNAGGVGVLVPGVKTYKLGNIIKAEEAAAVNPGRIYIAEDFLNACKYIVRKAG